ncbi:hypothetical protein ABT246_38415 [Streptomyces sp. NPDC001553]|uniref:hypothetical protein n=1 Tax=Streptomyces sp. NPDC001553 TaxID=3154385 RepID=UPI003330AE03
MRTCRYDKVLIPLPAGRGPAGDGTEVTVTATDLPAGIGQADHQAGIASSPAHLASYVEGAD